MATPSEFEQLINFIKITQDGNYSTAAGLSLLTFDIFSTLQDEIRYIWRSKWSIAKVAYLLARYWGMVFMIVTMAVMTSKHSIEFCQGYLVYQSFGGDLICTIIVCVISTLRVYALYGNSLKVLAFLVAACACGFSMEFYAAWSATQVALPTVWDLPIPQLKGCFGRMPKSAVKRTLFGWIPSVVIAFMFLAMTLAKFRQSLRDHRARGGSSLSPLFLIIVRDGALFFFLILLTTAILTTSVFYKEGIYHRLVAPWLHVSFSCVAARLVINLHSTARVRSLHHRRDYLGQTIIGEGTTAVALKPMVFSDRRGGDTETGIATEVNDERESLNNLGTSVNREFGRGYWTT